MLENWLAAKYDPAMARSGALQLKDYPTDIVRLACMRCDRRGKYRKATLIAKHRGDIALPTLLTVIAKCERQGRMSDACGVYYVELKPKD